MTQNSNSFAGFTYEKPVVETLKEGDHSVIVHSHSLTDSFHLLNGELKDGLAELIEKEEKWSDSTPQLAVVLVSANNDGVMTYRFNAMGYKHTDDFTAEELEDDKYTVIDGYVCVRNKQKQLVRIKCEQRTQKAKRLLNQFLYSTGAKEGTDLFDILDNCVADKTKIGITVKKKTHNDKPVYDIARFAPQAELVDASEGVDSDDF